MAKSEIKEVQKTRSKKLKLYILKTIFEKNKLPDDIKRNKCSYHLKPFLVNKIVEKKGYATWQFTKLGLYLYEQKELQIYQRVNTFVTRKTHKTKIRGHGFMWTIQLPYKCHISSEKRYKLLKRKNYEITTLDKGKQKVFIRGHNIHLNKRSITVYFDKTKNFIGKSATESYKLALYELEAIIRSCEQIYKTSLRIKKRYKFKISRHHYGHLNNELAVHYKNKDSFVRVFDNGKVWLTMDFSDKQYIEAETVDKDQAIYDQDSIIQPFMNTIRHDPNILDKLIQENHQLKELIQSNQQMLNILLDERNKSSNFNSFKY